ncbi:probable CCR4-associated factor 1 homolog 11 [Panicum virgatum]|uniref:poly(A)-specific ribonuclease n=1 Tax=Panicum virgatum TaxID=38727 RepID=A0A8T0T3Q5_PANVG|nr:probable CCR4-associated factor 1 homolog 11 [Panicum virgatum]KAG2606312.1 hypothetical protein PVAP13_4NG085800 [Panicum virgatum]
MHPAQPPFPMAQYALHYHHAVPMPPPPPPPGIPVRTVWEDNLEPELVFLRNFAANARYAAVTVHYPGVVHGAQQSHGLMTAEARYATMKANADALKPIQLGLAVYNDFGHVAAWEFNLRGFHPAADPHAPSSVEYLKRRGLSFRDHQAHGVAAARLAAGLDGCGLFRRPGVSWATYAGAYHVAYLLKILSLGNNGGGGALLPDSLGGFLDAVRQCLGEDVYDVVRMAADRGLPPGLERVAADLSLVPAALSPRLAGAGSVLALQAFMRLKYYEFGGEVNRFRGLIHGIQVT